MDALEMLPDEARVRLSAADGPLAPTDAAVVISAIDRLFCQFHREGRVERWAAATAASGAVLVIAHVGEALSGCSLDTLGRLLLEQGRRTGSELMTAPRAVVVADAHPPRCMSRAQVREAIQDGRLSGESPAFDLSPTTLGGWRRHGQTTVGACWIGTGIPRRAG